MNGRYWCGISFYGGEGYGGVGGIVEEDIESDSFRYYRSHRLLDVSTSHLAYFGDNLWIATARYGECGTGVGVGVLSAFFDNDEMYAELFQSQKLAGAPANDDGPPYAVLWGRISELRPNFAWQYVQELNGLEPHSEKDKSE